VEIKVIKMRIAILALILILSVEMVDAQCSVSSVYFENASGSKICAGCVTEKKTLYAGELGISLVVETSGCADGTRVKFELYQDTSSGDVLQKTIDYPEGVTIKSNKANTTWKPEWIEDTSNNDGDGDPEYFLKAYVEGDGSGDTTGAGVDWNIKVRQTVTGVYGPRCSVEYPTGYIRCVKIQILDVPTWGSWWSNLWTWAMSDEIYINTTFKNIGSTRNLRLDLYDATGEERVLCVPWDPWKAFNPFSPACTENVPSGETRSWVVDTGKSFIPGIDDPTKTLFSFNGIVIIRLVDVDTDEVVEERTIPIYYENLTIFNESNDEARNVSDPFIYTHQLILDGSCNEVGGDFTMYGVYKKEAFPGGFWETVVSTAWGGIYDAVTGKTINSPLPICESGQDYGVVDAEVWQDIETKLPNGNSLHYLLNQQEYTTYEIKTCKEEDYTIETILHQAQYKELCNTFFKDEKLYKKLNEWYKIVLPGWLKPIGEFASEARANQVYCFKTHLKDTRQCYAVNYGWYSLTDMHPINETHPADSSYIYDIRRWNYDQEIEELV